MQADYYLGLDLGQTTDFTALTVVERSVRFEGEQGEFLHALRHLQRFPLGTPYGEIVTAVARMVASRPLQGQAVLTVDHTGVGRPVVEMLRQGSVACRIVPVTITAGHSVTQGGDGSMRVPKADLVTSVLLAFQSRRLKIPRALPDTGALVQELLNFRTKITAAGNEVFESRRDRDHDDLVLALALAVWSGEKDTMNYWEPPIGVVVPGRRPI
jgi:hypothetical protein